jgi:hypothetical protein
MSVRRGNCQNEISFRKRRETTKEEKTNEN